MSKESALEQKHHLVAEALANGKTNKAAGQLVDVSESSVIRWKRRQDFRDLIEHYRPASRVAQVVQAQQHNYDLLKEARDAEILLTVELRNALEKVIGVISKRLEHMSDEEMENLAIRHLSPLLKVVGEGLGIVQLSHDRFTGYGLLIKELEAILESRQTLTDAN